MAHLATFKLPEITNEPNHHYEPGSKSRKAVLDACAALKAEFPIQVPLVVNGKRIKGKTTGQQLNPSDHASVVCEFAEADPAIVQDAINGALEAQKTWSAMPSNDRAAIFLKAADLISGKYRAKLCAATMLGQGKNAWQAEIDAAAELVDFLRFGVGYVEDLYKQQPPKNAPGVWNRVEYRPLEGFVLAIAPFNFTAIAGNLVAAPAMLGNVCLFKPSPMAVLSNYIVYQIFEEAGLPPGVIQFLPGRDAPAICSTAFSSPHFAALHFTGSTKVFKSLWKDISSRVDSLRSYPRIVGETGGKNFHLLHPTADLKNAVLQTVRAGFEYQGQKCSACSRVYVPQSLWSEFQSMIIDEIKQLKVGPPELDPAHFVGPVISQASFDKITSLIKQATDSGSDIIAGGTGDASKGYFIQPTLLLSKTPDSITMVEELFGPVITAYVYPDDQYEATCALIDSTSVYALTGAVFAQDRQAVITASNLLRNAAGNFYINDKCTGAVVGQQPFGGGRASGTNDKAGSLQLLTRFVNTRTIKETFVAIDDVLYPSNLA